jgi:plastocyanin
VTGRSRIAGLGLAAVALATAACGRSVPTTGPVEVEGGATTESGTGSDSGPRRRVDPRRDGFEVGFGEFAVTLEAPAIRPGPVTFVVRNGGKQVHGFEMELELNEDSSGPGSGGDDGFKVEEPTFDPGETIRVDLDLETGLYKVECFVANHDDLGMEALLEVRPDAPKVRQQPAAEGGDAVAVQGFAFQPTTIEVPPGTEVTWTNGDPEAHTVTAEGGEFDSGPIEPGGTFAATLQRPGAVTYVCAIHPSMRGTVRIG